MGHYTPTQIENMSVNGEKKTKLSESVGARGDGTLVFKKQKGAVEAYYRYRDGSSDSTLLIGRYSRTGKTGLTATEIRDEARSYARLRQEIAPIDLKEHLKLEEGRRLHEMEEQKRHAEIEASRGTLGELCSIYVASLENRQAASAGDVKNNLNYNVIKPFPVLAERKANTITGDDLLIIFKRVLEHSVTRTYNMVRSNLMAAFNLGIRADYNPRQQLAHGKRFYLKSNPVDLIAREPEFDQVRERSLTNDELYQFWHFVEYGQPTVSPLYGLLLRFCVSCFGNRPEQLNDIRWKDINFTEKTLRFIDTKGKNAVPKKRIIPLTDRAMIILEKAKIISGNFDGPFRITGKAPVDVSNLGSFVGHYNDWLQNKALGEGKQPPERFTTRDLRRTATRLFTDCRVLQEHRYLLQSRGDGSIESKHYDHDDRLPEKRDVAKIYDHYLGRIIDGTINDQPDNVIQLQQTEPAMA